MTSSLRFVIVALLVLVLTSACSGWNPNEPDPVIPHGPQPKPLPGTNTVTVPLLDSPTPMLLWAEVIIPAEGKQLEPGQEAVVALACTGPGGYRYFIRSSWVVEGQPEQEPSGGFGSVTGPKCDFPIGGAKYRYQPVPGAMRVKALRLFIWVKAGTDGSLGSVTRPPDVTGDITVPGSWRPLVQQ